MNLTGDNIQTVLDNLLYRALEPLVSNTCVFDTQLVHILSKITVNKKRKLVSTPRDKAISLLCLALTEKNVNLKLQHIKDVKIERCTIHRFLTNILKDLDVLDSLYVEQYTQFCPVRKRKIEAMLKFLSATTDADTLFIARKQIRDFLNQYFDYRASVLEHYIKHGYKMSNNFRQSKTNMFDSKDVMQNFLAAITKAIDKYDSSKGALTTYINYWLLNAQTCNSNSSEYGIAYTLPHGVKKNYVSDKTCVNFSVQLDAETVDSESHVPSPLDGIENEEADSIIRYLVKSVDRYGCFRLKYDIDEYFHKSEYKMMQKIMGRTGNRRSD